MTQKPEAHASGFFRQNQAYIAKASPGGKLAPQATEGECVSLGLNYYTRTENRAVLPATPLQSLRDSFPSGDAFLSHIRSVLSIFFGVYVYSVNSLTLPLPRRGLYHSRYFRIAKKDGCA